MPNFPTSLDSLSNPAADDYLNSPSHAAQHSNVNDIVEALEAKLGIGASTPAAGKLLYSASNGQSSWGISFLDEDDMASDSDVSVPSQQSVKKYVDDNGGVDWKSYSAVIPTRASADDPTYVLTFAGVDLTSILNVGKKVKWTQNGTVRYGIVTAIAFSTNTTLTIYGGTDYDVDDTGTYAISAFHYSSYKSPIGFPLSPAKWSVKTSDTSNRAQASPSDGIFYNLGGLNIVIPIGVWDVEYDVWFRMEGGSYKQGKTTLSTANNSESDSELSCAILLSNITSYFASNYNRGKLLTLASKTTYYLNAKQDSSGTNIQFEGSFIATKIRAVCAYL